MVAINAMRSASANHSFISVTGEGKVAVFRTEGNPALSCDSQGGKSPNYDAESVAACEAALTKGGHKPNVMIDCSHGNSRKDWRKQLDVLKEVAQQVQNGSQSIIGVMLESNLQEGNQPIPDDLEEIRPGVSITDACLGWETTETALRELAAAVGPALKSRAS